MSHASLTVRLNEDRPHDLSVAPAFSANKAFVIELVNEGQAVHVHLNVDDELARVATLSGGNHYVDGGQTKQVEVLVSPPDEPVTGKLKIVTGYGSETSYVDVTVEPGPDGKPPVDVDETLSKPAPEESNPSPIESLEDAFPGVDPDALPLVALAVLALVLAVGIASVFQSFAITLGAGVVVGGVVVAVALTLL